ncbi:hypothetical protein PHSC3_000628 [Chlamydiales bacterium STE3]|nr:hypothetical protein PHSC3_000628 [Chlamydiales bacterium STE3]
MKKLFLSLSCVLSIIAFSGCNMDDHPERRKLPSDTIPGTPTDVPVPQPFEKNTNAPS